MEQTTTTAGKKQMSSGIIKRAAAEAGYPIQRAPKAIRALDKRIELAGGDVERALTEDRWWKSRESVDAGHERMFCTLFVLYSCEYPCDEWAIRSQIIILGEVFAACSFPILKNNSFKLDPTGPREVPQHRQHAECHLN